MKDANIIIIPNKIENAGNDKYSSDIKEFFTKTPKFAQHLIESSIDYFNLIQDQLYKLPSLITTIKNILPQDTYKLLLTDKQKQKLADGTLKLMTTKYGALKGHLVNPKNGKIVAIVDLKKINLTPEINQKITNFTLQMQLGQIAEQIQMVQLAVEEVRMGQEYDRLATAYSCQQKFLQSINIQNQELRTRQLQQLVFDAEDSRNLLIQSQTSNITFIKEQPEENWLKLIKGASPDKINKRMNEIRQSLCAVNMVSLIEAMSYQELGETEAAWNSLEYYRNYIEEMYLSKNGFLERLDSIDSSPYDYWTKLLPKINNTIKLLPYNKEKSK